VTHETVHTNETGCPLLECYHRKNRASPLEIIIYLAIVGYNRWTLIKWKLQKDVCDRNSKKLLKTAIKLYLGSLFTVQENSLTNVMPNWGINVVSLLDERICRKLQETRLVLLLDNFNNGVVTWNHCSVVHQNLLLCNTIKSRLERIKIANKYTQLRQNTAVWRKYEERSVRRKF
jgi:hypothetical protein